MNISLPVFIKRAHRARIRTFLSAVQQEFTDSCPIVEAEVETSMVAAYQPKKSWLKGAKIHAFLQRLLAEKASEAGFVVDEKPNRPEITVDGIRILGSRIRSHVKAPQFLVRQARSTSPDQIELEFEDVTAATAISQDAEIEVDSTIEMVIGVQFGKRQKQTYYSEPTHVVVGVLNDTRDGYAFPPIAISNLIAELQASEQIEAEDTSGVTAIVDFVINQIQDLDQAEDKGVQKVE